MKKIIRNELWRVANLASQYASLKGFNNYLPRTSLTTDDFNSDQLLIIVRITPHRMTQEQTDELTMLLGSVLEFADDIVIHYPEDHPRDQKLRCLSYRQLTSQEVNPD